MTSVKDPRKLARDVIREYGGRVHSTDRSGTSYIFPDMSVLLIGSNEHFGSVTRKLEGLRARFGTVYSELSSYTNRPNKPRIDFERLRASDHARDRLELMRAQRAITSADILNCLRLPERVLWSPTHESWLWVRDDIGVAVVEVPDGFLIVTVLWSRQELFDAFPRPDREVRR